MDPETEIATTIRIRMSCPPGGRPDRKDYPVAVVLESINGRKKKHVIGFGDYKSPEHAFAGIALSITGVLSDLVKQRRAKESTLRQLRQLTRL